jgi:hypothetical protein
LKPSRLVSDAAGEFVPPQSSQPAKESAKQTREQTTAPEIYLKRERTMETIAKRLASGMSKCIGAAAILLLTTQPTLAQTRPPDYYNVAVWTDKGDYRPGETVTITGANFQQGELVAIVLKEDPHVHADVTVWSNADSTGDFVNTDFSPDVHDLGVTFTIRATGQTSGLVAVGYFTDGVDPVPLPTCDFTVGGVAPTHLTIQAAVTALPGVAGTGPCRIVIRPGTYIEAVSVAGKNGAATTDAQRVVIRPETPSTVTVTAPGGMAASDGSNIAFRFSNSKFITVRGIEITACTRAAVNMTGGSAASQDITIEGNNIHDNGVGPSNFGGVSMNRGNLRIWVVNNLIRNNNLGGIRTSDSSGGPAYFVNNTIYANTGAGIVRSSASGANWEIHVVNDLIVANGGLGVLQSGSGNAALATLKNNIFYNNTGGDIDTDDILDVTDSGNRTTNGHATTAISTTTGIDGCTFYAPDYSSPCTNTHAVTEIFVSASDFHLRTTPPISPAIDKGLITYVDDGFDWVPSVANARPAAPVGDFEGTPRPQDGNLNPLPTATSENDAGYDEVPAAAVCGDGTVEGTEQCDQGAATNGTLGSCCSATCTFKPSNTACTDDGNACTADQCNGTSATCQHPAVADNTPCSDGLFCNGTDTCSAGACTVHTGDPCAGGTECNNICDEAADTCFSPAGAQCTDTTPNDCQDAQCNGLGSCNQAAANQPDTTTCDDGFFCTVGDTCTAGVCGGAGRDCSDNIDCTTDSCNEATDSCDHAPVNLACDDDDPSTVDICDPTSGCEHTVLPSTPGKVTGGGQIPGELAELDILRGTNAGGRANFGFIVQLDENETIPSGNLVYKDKGIVMEDVKATSFESLFIAGNRAIFRGKATVNGVPNVDFMVDITDMGEPGSNPTPPPDTFRIVVGNGYTAGGVLLGGNIQVHSSP